MFTRWQITELRCCPYYLRRVPRVFLWLLGTFLQMQIQNAISSNRRKQPDGIIIVAGDFNDTYLRTVLPKFHQHVKFPKDKEISSTLCIQIYLTATKPYNVFTLASQILFLCSFCLHTLSWKRWSNRWSKLFKSWVQHFATGCWTSLKADPWEFLAVTPPLR